MSWWVHLKCPCCNSTVEVESHQEGATICLGGTSEASLNVTYNYGKHFSFGTLAGKTGQESIPILEDAIQLLGTERDPDYWKSTKGNAGYACAILLAWAKKHPKAIWDIS